MMMLLMLLLLLLLPNTPKPPVVLPALLFLTATLCAPPAHSQNPRQPTDYCCCLANFPHISDAQRIASSAAEAAALCPASLSTV